MATSYAERGSSTGVTVVELSDHKPVVLWLSVIGTGVFIVLYRSDMGVALFVLALLLLPAAAGVFYIVSRKRVRIVLDARRRTLTLERRAIQLDQIARAELASVEGERESPASTPQVFHRVDLVLRSGERVETIKGYGEFDVEDCHRLVAFINAAVRVR